jgi:hypothetical protein
MQIRSSYSREFITDVACDVAVACGIARRLCAAAFNEAILLWIIHIRFQTAEAPRLSFIKTQMAIVPFFSYTGNYFHCIRCIM